MYKNVLFPLGLSSLPITEFAYDMRVKAEVRDEIDKKINDLKKQLEIDLKQELTEQIKKELTEQIKKELTEQIKKELENDLKVKIYNEVYEKILEDIRRHDSGWEKLESDHKNDFIND